MSFKTISVYKKYAITHRLELNKTYNIESLTGVRFKDPTVFYTIVKLKTKEYTYSTDIYYNVDYPNITFKNGGSNVDNVLIDCIFYEKGDNNVG